MTLIVAAAYAAVLMWLADNARAHDDPGTEVTCFASAAWVVLWSGVSPRLFADVHSVGTAAVGTVLAALFLIAALSVGRTDVPVYGAYLPSHRRTNTAVMVAASATFAVIAAAAV